MENLLKKANRVGLLIKKSDVYQNYETKKQQLEQNKKSYSLYESYLEISSNLENRKKSSDIIENYEFEEYKELLEVVSNDEIILDFFKSHENYINLLTKVQEKMQ